MFFLVFQEQFEFFDEGRENVLREENLPGHLEQKESEQEAPTPGEAQLDDDAQLKRAVELLKGWEVFKQLVQKRAA